MPPQKNPNKAHSLEKMKQDRGSWILAWICQIGKLIKGWSESNPQQYQHWRKAASTHTAAHQLAPSGARYPTTTVKPLKMNSTSNLHVPCSSILYWQHTTLLKHGILHFIKIKNILFLRNYQVAILKLSKDKKEKKIGKVWQWILNILS